MTREIWEQILFAHISDEVVQDMLNQYVLELESSNAELREELAKARDPQRIGGQADPSSFVYAIEQLREFRWQHATNDEDAIPYINNVAAAHERENAKLRELVQDMWGFIENADRLNDNAGCTDYCEHDTTDDGCCKTGKCWYEQRLRELGVEVGE